MVQLGRDAPGQAAQENLFRIDEELLDVTLPPRLGGTSLPSAGSSMPSAGSPGGQPPCAVRRQGSPPPLPRIAERHRHRLATDPAGLRADQKQDRRDHLFDGDDPPRGVALIPLLPDLIGSDALPLGAHPS